MENVINVELKISNRKAPTQRDFLKKTLKRKNTTFWWLKCAQYSAKDAKLATLSVREVAQPIASAL